jgi:sugar lactone lactonase YvrE
MRTKLFLLAAGVLTISLVSAPAQIYDFTTIAGAVTNSGSADGTNSNAQFYSPVGVAVDGSGNLYVGDWGNSIIRKIAPVGTNWVTTTIAGSVTNSGTADGTNSNARFSLPHNVAVDTNGNLYVADTSNETIRKVTPAGTNWVTTTIAGSAGNYGSADGTNSDAQFYFPAGIAVDGSGSLYVADTYNNTIRKVTPVGTNWVTSTIAGSVTNSGSADGTNSNARFNCPYGIAMDAANGNLYVADTYNNTIRKVTPVGTNWVTTTIAGLALNDGSTDGTNSTARFSSPVGIAVDGDGNIYVADMSNNTIRKVSPVGMNWVVSTIGGLAGNAGSADGLNNHARFSSPFGVAVDANGSLYVTDEGNDTIRQGVPWGTLTITKETAMLNFVKTNSDSCTLTGTLTLEPGFSVTNKAVTVDIGGAQALFTLDAKGSGTSPPNTCKLSYNKKTVLWTFTAKLKSGSWATPWAAYGLSNSTVTASSVTLPATLVIGDEGFYGEKNLLYKAKAGKSGSAK